MHTLGKVLAFFVLIAAVVAAIFTSKVVLVRNSWTTKLISLKKNYSSTLRPQLDELEAKVDRLKSDLDRSHELWGRFWPDVQTNSGGADGSLNLNIGLESGVHQNMVLHGFEIAPDGSSIYRGSFLVTEVANGNSVVKPNWRATPAEIQKWQNGNWRWRNTIPSGYQENNDRQLLTNLKYEETLTDRKKTLDGQNVLLKQANDGLKLREAELVGGDILPKTEVLEPEFREGLVAAVEQTEETRNKTLKEIDDLRRKVRAIQAEIERLNAENEGLVKKLPGPGAETKPGADPKLSQKR